MGDVLARSTTIWTMYLNIVHVPKGIRFPEDDLHMCKNCFRGQRLNMCPLSIHHKMILLEEFLRAKYLGLTEAEGRAGVPHAISGWITHLHHRGGPCLAMKACWDIPTLLLAWFARWQVFLLLFAKIHEPVGASMPQMSRCQEAAFW